MPDLVTGKATPAVIQLLCFLPINLHSSSRWSTLTLHMLLSVMELKTWLPSCWSTIPCTGCPSRGSCVTHGCSNTPPESPPPLLMKSRVSDAPETGFWMIPKQQIVSVFLFRCLFFSTTTSSQQPLVFLFCKHVKPLVILTFYSVSFLSSGIHLPVNIFLLLLNNESFMKPFCVENGKINVYAPSLNDTSVEGDSVCVAHSSVCCLSDEPGQPELTRIPLNQETSLSQIKCFLIY